jgi:hypothetical protein
MTLAEAAIAAGYDAEDEKHVPTVGYFSIIKGLRAMKEHLADHPDLLANHKRLLLEAVNDL